MKLITKEIERITPRIGETEHLKFEEKIYTAKFFFPAGRGTWYMAEYDPADRVAFGWVVSPLGPDCDEGGYFSIDEMENVVGPLGLKIERDIHWKPGRLPEGVVPR